MHTSAFLQWGGESLQARDPEVNRGTRREDRQEGERARALTRADSEAPINQYGTVAGFMLSQHHVLGPYVSVHISGTVREQQHVRI